MNKGAFISLAMCLFFSSCLKKNYKQEAQASSPAYFVDVDFQDTAKREQHFIARKRAQLSNQSSALDARGIPYMIDAEFAKQQSEQKHLRLEYKTKYNLPLVTAFYEQEMEFLGWEKLFLYEDSDNEILLVFTKPNKTIVVQGKREKSKYKIVIFTPVNPS